jgi:hypothetical protein
MSTSFCRLVTHAAPRHLSVRQRGRLRLGALAALLVLIPCLYLMLENLRERLGGRSAAAAETSP